MILSWERLTQHIQLYNKTLTNTRTEQFHPDKMGEMSCAGLAEPELRT